MDKEKLIQIIKTGENQEIEFKEGCPSETKLSEVICGFANADGGFLFLGIGKNGEVKGLECNLDKLQQNIANARQHISSSPHISTTIHTITDKRIVVIEVAKANDKNAHTFNGAVYVRMGSTTQKLEGQSLIDF